MTPRAGLSRSLRAHRLRWILGGVVVVCLIAVVAAGAYLAPVLALMGQRGDAGAGQASGAPVVTPPPLTDSHRINILLLGSDNDVKFEANAVLSQTMIVLSVDPVHHQVLMLSIPRDLWVDLPGHGQAKIDLAYAYGGAALARQVVERDFKIPIHYYAWIGLDGLVRVIDRFGGVDVDVLHPVVDDTYPADLRGDPYGYERVYLAAGPQHLDGIHALQYVRSRHGDLLSDFGRSERQQQLLLALQTKTSAIDLLASLPALGRDLNGHVRTDLDVVRVAQLVVFARGLHREDIHQAYLFQPMVTGATSPDGQDILIPNWSLILPQVRALFGGEVLP
jgi:LCP family protein required for cell wall assembly